MLRILLLVTVLGFMAVASPNHEKSGFWCKEAKARPWIIEQLFVARAQKRDLSDWNRRCLSRRGHAIWLDLRVLCISEPEGREAELVEEALRQNEQSCEEFHRASEGNKNE